MIIRKKLEFRNHLFRQCYVSHHKTDTCQFWPPQLTCQLPILTTATVLSSEAVRRWEGACVHTAETVPWGIRSDSHQTTIRFCSK